MSDRLARRLRRRILGTRPEPANDEDDMTRHHPRPFLTREDQADEVLRINALARTGAAMVRCDGTLAEYRDYLAGDDEIGWRVSGEPVRGDLLLSSIVVDRVRMIVSFSLVEGVSSGDVLWEEETDIAVVPAVPWRSVMDAANLRLSRAKGSLTGNEREKVVAALVETLRSSVDVGDEEGERRWSSCRERSRSNRHRKLEEANGVCKGCYVNLRTIFGIRGDRGLEVHHLTPLSTQPEGQVTTKLSDLVVLCATCHRLLHADPNKSLEALRAQWALS